MNDLKLIQNHSRKVPRASGHPKTSQNIILSDPGPSGKKSKFRQKPIIPSSFGTHFSHFRHADACVALREASRLTLNDSQSIYLCSLRVIRGQSGASQILQKLRLLEDLGVPKLSFLEIYEKVWLHIIFWQLNMLF